VHNGDDSTASSGHPNEWPHQSGKGSDHGVHDHVRSPSADLAWQRLSSDYGPQEGSGTVNVDDRDRFNLGDIAIPESFRCCRTLDGALTRTVGLCERNGYQDARLGREGACELLGVLSTSTPFSPVPNEYSHYRRLLLISDSEETYLRSTQRVPMYEDVVMNSFERAAAPQASGDAPNPESSVGRSVEQRGAAPQTQSLTPIPRQPAPQAGINANGGTP
jgi:hypothetical protein